METEVEVEEYVDGRIVDGLAPIVADAAMGACQNKYHNGRVHVTLITKHANYDVRMFNDTWLHRIQGNGISGKGTQVRVTDVLAVRLYRTADTKLATLKYDEFIKLGLDKAAGQ